MTATSPARGEIWDVDLNPSRGHEQAGRRPALVVSVNLFNQGAAQVSGLTMNEVEGRLRILLGL